MSLCLQGVGAEASPKQEPMTAMVLHGLLGNSRNWRSFAKKFAQEAADRCS